jgi:hypothetical protein
MVGYFINHAEINPSRFTLKLRAKILESRMPEMYRPTVSAVDMHYHILPLSQS